MIYLLAMVCYFDCPTLSISCSLQFFFFFFFFFLLNWTYARNPFTVFCLQWINPVKYHTCELAAFFQQVSASVKDDPFLLSDDWLLGVLLDSSTALTP